MIFSAKERIESLSACICVQMSDCGALCIISCVSVLAVHMCIPPTLGLYYVNIVCVYAHTAVVCVHSLTESVVYVHSINMSEHSYCVSFH